MTGSGGRPFRIGVISDTHEVLSPQAEAALAGADAIVHAGDIGDGFVLDLLEHVAPVTAVDGGNNYHTDRRFPPLANVMLGGVRVVVAHRAEDLTGDGASALNGARLVVTGHTHVAGIEGRDGVLWVNPGSPTLPRMGQRPSVAVVDVAEDGRLAARIVEL